MNRTITSNEDQKIRTHYKRTTSMERTQHIKQLLRMKQEQNVIEKDLSNFMESMKIESDVRQDLLRDQIDMCVKRQAVVDSLIKTTSSIATDFNTAKNVTLNSEGIKKLDVNGYKSKLMELYSKIREYKKNCLLQTLCEEQLTLDSDLQAFTSNLQKYKEPINDAFNYGKMYGVTKNSLLNSLDSNKNHDALYYDYNEIQDFHKLIAKTGHTGNWSNDDHLLFLKIRKKCKTIPALVLSIRDKCPDLSTEAIINHEAWYKAYLNLREKQKERLKEWQTQKRYNEAKRIEEGKKYIEEQFQDNGKTVSVSEKTIPNCVKDSNNIDKLQTDKKKNLIKQWKMEKEKKHLMDDEQLKNQRELKSVKEKWQKQRTKKIKENSYEFREKSSKDVTGQKICRNASKEKHDSTLLKAFRIRDEDTIKRRKHLLSSHVQGIKMRPMKNESLCQKNQEMHAAA